MDRSLCDTERHVLIRPLDPYPAHQRAHQLLKDQEAKSSHQIHPGPSLSLQHPGWAQETWDPMWRDPGQALFYDKRAKAWGSWSLGSTARVGLLKRIQESRLGFGLCSEFGQNWDRRHGRLKSGKAHLIPPTSSQGLAIKAGHQLGPVGRRDKEVMSPPPCNLTPVRPTDSGFAPTLTFLSFPGISSGSGSGDEVMVAAWRGFRSD